MTDAHVACLLRAARSYQRDLVSEIERLEQLAKSGSVVAAADAATKAFEKTCLLQAIRILWNEHSERTMTHKPKG